MTASPARSRSSLVLHAAIAEEVKPVVVDVLFPVLGDCLPTDHAYPLYAALARVVPAFHDPVSDIRFAPVSGAANLPGHITLTPHSRLRVRVPDTRIRDVLSLAEKHFEVAGRPINFGVPTVAVLLPAATVSARLVTFKHRTSPETFLEHAREQLGVLGIRADAVVPVRRRPGVDPEPVRRVVRVKGTVVVGFALRVEGLSDVASLRLQAAGLGGRTKLGCGFFLPAGGAGERFDLVEVPSP
jgi:CRISPR-associated protein Cas6